LRDRRKRTRYNESMMQKIIKALEEYRSEDLPQKANASVLVPLFQDRSGVGLVLIHRAQDSGPHSGQMGFPGGMVEKTDGDDLLATALRESHEEIGILPGDVEIIGALNQRKTVLTKLTVKPFVGVIPYPYPFHPDGREVQGITTANLRELAESLIVGENPFGLPSPVYPLKENPVWGLTARMITELLGVIGEQ